MEMNEVYGVVNIYLCMVPVGENTHRPQKLKIGSILNVVYSESQFEFRKFYNEFTEKNPETDGKIIAIWKSYEYNVVV
jgi:ABC-type sulfate transport system substrate-binding protein